MSSSALLISQTALFKSPKLWQSERMHPISRIRVFGTMVVAALVLSCDPGTISVEILEYDSEVDDYDFKVVDIETLDNVSRLQGRATRLVGDAVLELNYQSGMMKWIDPGYRVAFAAVTSDGVLIPEDFDSLAMVSIYYHIERSLLFFEKIGFDSSRLVSMETYYWPKFTIIDSDGEEQIQKDNAFYLYATKDDRGFYVFPYELYGWLPLSMNGGVMTHEYAHSVFDALVSAPNRERIDGGGLSRSAANFLYGLNEGFADTMAVARVGDPDYMQHSIDKNAYIYSCNGMVLDVTRDASQLISYENSMDNSARNTPEAFFCPYAIGAFVSSVMFAIEQRIDGDTAEGGEIPSGETREQISGAFVRALDSIGQNLSFDFELYDAFGLFISELPTDEARTAACEILSEAYAMYYDETEGC